jgi:GNAT superfamily N-acetyltransferase
VTFTYLSDVYVDKRHRKRGLSKWFLDHILATDYVTNVRSVFLMTKYVSCRWHVPAKGSTPNHSAYRSAQKLYAKFGFEVVENRCMVYRPGVAKDVGRYDWRLVEYI